MDGFEQQQQIRWFLYQQQQQQQYFNQQQQHLRQHGGYQVGPPPPTMPKGGVYFPAPPMPVGLHVQRTTVVPSRNFSGAPPSSTQQESSSSTRVSVSPAGFPLRRRTHTRPLKVQSLSAAQAQEIEHTEALMESASHFIRPLKPDEEEIDQRRLSQRRKQINFGKITDGYRHYRFSVPRHSRQYQNPSHPITPPLLVKCSKRKWDSLVAAWRRALHLWDDDPPDHTMVKPNMRTLGEMKLVETIPLDKYVAETKKELLSVKNAIDSLHEKTESNQFPGENCTEGDSRSCSDFETGSTQRVVLASKVTAMQRQSQMLMNNESLEVSDQCNLPYVPSPDARSGTKSKRKEGNNIPGLAEQQQPQSAQPGVDPELAGGTVIYIVQRFSSGRQKEMAVQLTSTTRDGIIDELRQHSIDLGKLYVKAPTKSSPRPQTPPQHQNDNEAQSSSTPTGQQHSPPKGLPGTPRVIIKNAETQHLSFSDRSNLDLVLSGQCTKLYYECDVPLGESGALEIEEDVRRELQLTPTRMLCPAAQYEHAMNDITFSSSAAGAAYTPNPMLYNAALSPHQFFQISPGPTQPSHVAMSTGQSSSRSPLDASPPRVPAVAQSNVGNERKRRESEKKEKAI